MDAIHFDMLGLGHIQYNSGPFLNFLIQILHHEMRGVGVNPLRNSDGNRLISIIHRNSLPKISYAPIIFLEIELLIQKKGALLKSLFQLKEML